MSETKQKKTYDPTDLERRWQERWAESGLYETDGREQPSIALRCPYPG